MAGLDSLRSHFRRLGEHLQGPPILALHGFLGSGEDFSYLVKLDAGYFTWSTLELPGHISTAPLPDKSLDLQHFLDQIEQARQMVTQESGHKPVLLGYSMGGRLALHAALDHPEKYAALVTIGATPGIGDPDQRVARRLADDALADHLRHGDYASFLEIWHAQPIIRSQENIRREIREPMLARRRRADPNPLAAVLATMSPGRIPDRWSDLSNCTLPCLLVAGEADEKFRAIAERMGEFLPNATVATIPGAGHCAHLEEPEAFLAALKAFSKSIRR